MIFVGVVCTFLALVFGPLIGRKTVVDVDKVRLAAQLDDAYEGKDVSAHGDVAKAVHEGWYLSKSSSRRCLDKLPKYDGCNQADVVEAIHVCVGSLESKRFMDNRDLFPVRAGTDMSRNDIFVGPVPKDIGEPSQLIFYYPDTPSKKDCEQIGGLPRTGHWLVYTGCAPDEAAICDASAKR